MNQIIHLLYSCNAWHEYSSHFFHGLFSTRAKAIEGLTMMLANRGQVPPLSEEDIKLLERVGQTQGYEGEGEFIIVSAPVDEIYCWL